ncbi:MAG: hypothetical protein FJ335_06930 [Sphingomonadales bacterium]|nr:hypothetical protein [Sphingomonadales bacterium]
MPALKQLINGIADRVDFTVSGVSSETLRLALEDRETIKNAALHVGYVSFDADWQIMGPPTWEWQGIADYLTTGRTEDQRTITLSVRSANQDRDVPALSWFTDADQRKRSPTDSFFDRVASLSAGSTRRFGPR